RSGGRYDRRGGSPREARATGGVAPAPGRLADADRRDVLDRRHRHTGAATPMRTATLVLVAYVGCVIIGALWRLLPGPLHDAVPDLGALTAAYLGLTARRHLAPAVGGSIV